MSFLSIIYGFCGLFCVMYVLSFLWEVFRKKRAFSDVIVKEKALVVLAFMLAFAPWYWCSNILKEHVPDGDYRIDVAVSFPDVDGILLLPADIDIDSYVEESESHYYLGAVEMPSTKNEFNRDIYLETIYWDGGGDVFAENLFDEVRPETDEEIYIYDAEAGAEGYITVNIGVITPETLGLTLSDQWSDLSLWSKIEPALIVTCCFVGIYQYFNAKRKAL